MGLITGFTQFIPAATWGTSRAPINSTPMGRLYLNGGLDT